MSFLGAALGSAAISGGLGLVSNIFGNNSAKREAQRSRDWQEDMSNTSIQRRVADLKAAGLNPLLAVQNASSGASTPAGAQADIKHFDPSSINLLSNARLLNAQAKAQEQDNELHDLRKEALETENKLRNQGVLTAEVSRKLMEAQTDEARANILFKAYQAKGIETTIEKVRHEIDVLKEEKRLVGANADKVENEVNSFGNTPVGKDIEYVLDNKLYLPHRAAGALFSGLISATARGFKDFFEYAKKGGQSKGKSYDLRHR